MVRISTITTGPRRIKRLGFIAQRFIRHGFGYLVSRYVRLGYLPARFKLKKGPGGRPEPETIPQHLTDIMEELGPTSVKFGQMMATRPDIIPEDYIREFRRIYYKVTPFDSATARQIIQEQMGVPTEELFASFTDTPRASGSIAQVHDAVLKDGTPVVVKVRRPGIEKTIEDDLSLLHFIAEGANRIEELVPLRLPLIAREFDKGIRRELDFVNEASTITKFYNAFKDSESLVIPQVYWEYSSTQVLTLRRIEGKNFAQLEEEDFEGIDRKRLARIIAEAFIKQYFKTGIFHADPHPGNMIHLPDGRVGLIDFGLVGRLAGSLRSKSGTILIAASHGQFELAAQVFADLGVIPEDADRTVFISDVEELFQKYYGIPLKNLDNQRLFIDLMRVAREHNVAVPRDLVMLGKSVVMVSSLTRSLDSDLNIPELVKPAARGLFLEKVSPSSIQKGALEEMYEVSSLLVSGPRYARELLKKLLSGGLELKMSHKGLERHVAEIDKTGNRLALSIILASIIIGSSLILSMKIGPKVGSGAWEMSALGIFGYVLASALGFWLIFGIFRSGRL